MHELTSVAEMQRLFGPRIDEAIKVDVPGMEIGTQHKYAFDILVDVKPADSPMRPDTAASLAERLRTRRDDLCNTGAPAGFRRRPLRTDQDRPGPAVDDGPVCGRQRPPADLHRWAQVSRRIQSARALRIPVGRRERDTFVGDPHKTALDAEPSAQRSAARPNGSFVEISVTSTSR
jgi:hypothetical protein